MDNLFSTIPTMQGDRVTLRRLTEANAGSLKELTDSEKVYRYLPTFLYEQKYEDKAFVIRRLYDECLESSLILGVFIGDTFCGLAEIYGYFAPLSKVSVGYRLLEKWWGQGIATETLGVIVKYLFGETDVKVITASTMTENKASTNVLKKNGFKHMSYTVLENWGYHKLILTEKWINTKHDQPYRFRDHHSQN